MAPRRSGRKKVVRSVTRKVVKETVQVSIAEGDTGESTQEERFQDTEEIDVPVEEILRRTIPVEENSQQEEQLREFEIPVEKSSKDVDVEEQNEVPSTEENRNKEEQISEVFQQEPSREKEEERNKEDAASEFSHEESPNEEEVRKHQKTKENEAEMTTEDGSLEPETSARKEAKKKTQRREKPGEKQSNKLANERKRKRRSRATIDGDGGVGYKRYVYKVLKQVHPELRISSMAMSLINSLMKDMFERIADEAAKLKQYAQRTTLSYREIQDAVKLVLPGELGKHAIAEGSKAVSNYISYEGKKSKS
ncbi:hypothetical protein K2173_014059 [Erythroxylum novogranatense]|uniref:Core Histone H2A/H2B/H3 domain-containing protein n=1 Tax=Erythroxylum novogranatense TaxID=1862640 RepID=A0AAV8SDC8_9ROSI|nr:hypothetical protein K2173_014059 [Erythroxylum novogranatense]